MIPEAQGLSAFDRIAERLSALFLEGGLEPWPDDRFNALAHEVFTLQFEANGVYRSFCESRGATPDSVGDWSAVPTVPARAFKHLDLLSASRVEVTFRTSGTTSDIGRRGRHLVPSRALYDASLLPPFTRHVVPESEPIAFISFIPAPDEAAESSLSYMVGAAAGALSSTVTYAVDGAGTIDESALATALNHAQDEKKPVLLLGTAFAFVNAMEAPAVKLGPLPEGSRIMETGGFKGRSRELSRSDLYAALSAATGVQTGRIVNEYGMTELLSQLYEPVLAGEPVGCGHVPPPWLRVRALDPNTLAEVSEGESGILAFLDLANAGSVAHVLTEDFGSLRDGRVFLEGRAPGAEPRGCSRAMDDLMAAAK